MDDLLSILRAAVPPQQQAANAQLNQQQQNPSETLPNGRIIQNHLSGDVVFPPSPAALFESLGLILPNTMMSLNRNHSMPAALNSSTFPPNITVQGSAVTSEPTPECTETDELKDMQEVCRVRAFDMLKLKTPGSYAGAYFDDSTEFHYYASQPNVEPLSFQPLKAATITLIPRESRFYDKSIISADNNFIAYPIKNGRVRVIQQGDASFAALQGHEENVCELGFAPTFGKESSLLFAISPGGQFCLWKLYVIPEEERDPGSEDAVILLRVSGAKFNRCLWRPDGEEILLIANYSEVLLIDVNVFVVSDQPIIELDFNEFSTMRGVTKLSGINSTPTCANYATDCNSLLVGCEDGFMYWFRRGSRTAFKSGKVHDSAITFIFWTIAPISLVITASENNTVIKLLDTPTWVEMQVIRFKETTSLQLGFATSLSSLLVAHFDRSSIIVLPLLVDKNCEVRFVGIREFPVSNPILSMSIDDEFVGSGEDTRVFCVMEKSIVLQEIGSKDIWVDCDAFVFKGVEDASAGDLKILGRSDMNLPPLKEMSIEESINNVCDELLAMGNGAERIIEAEKNAAESAFEKVCNSIVTQAFNAASDDMTVDAVQKQVEEEIKRELEFMKQERKFLQQIGGQSKNIGDELLSDEDEETESTRLTNELLAHEQSMKITPILSVADNSKELEAINDRLCGLESAMITKKDLMEAIESLKSTFNDSLKASVEKAVSSQVEESTLCMQETLINYTKTDLTPQLIKAALKDISTSIEKTVTSTLQKTLTKQQALTPIVSAIQQNLSQTIQSNFEKVLIPAYQSASQSMFKQMQGAFKQGIEGMFGKVEQTCSQLDQTVQILTKTVETLSSKDIEGKRALEEIAQQQKQLGTVLANLSEQFGKISLQITEQEKSIKEAVASATTQTLTPALPVSVQPSTDPLVALKSAIGADLMKTDFESAFIKALESADLRAVNFVISQAPLRNVFTSSGQTRLSQGVLLSLVQQLSMDLQSQENISMKISWMEECVMSLQPKNQMISSHLKSVVPGIMNRLEVLARTVTDSNLSRQIKIIFHMARSIISV